jgi:hypothetical protein
MRWKFFETVSTFEEAPGIPLKKGSTGNTGLEGVYMKGLPSTIEDPSLSGCAKQI